MTLQVCFPTSGAAASQAIEQARALLSLVPEIEVAPGVVLPEAAGLGRAALPSLLVRGQVRGELRQALQELSRRGLSLFLVCDEAQLADLEEGGALYVPVLLLRAGGVPAEVERHPDRFFASQRGSRALFLGPQTFFESLVWMTFASGRYVVPVFRWRGVVRSERLGAQRLPPPPTRDRERCALGSCQLFRLTGAELEPMGSVFPSVESARNAAVELASAGEYVLGELAAVVDMF